MENALGSARVQPRQAYPLPACRVEIFRHKPALEGRLARRPFGIEHRVPGRVAVAALDDHVLAEEALEGEAETQRSAPPGGVERVALPLVAAVAERLERVAGEQILRLG